MAVYTALNEQQLSQLIAPYQLGDLVDAKGASGGIENTTYFLTLQSANKTQAEYVLTLFEQMSTTELPFFVELTSMLAARGLPVPCPLRDRQGQAIQHFGHGVVSKAVTLTPRVSGQHPQQASPEQCRTLGATLAKVHQACLAWPRQQASSRGLHWMQATAERLRPLLCSEQKREEQQLLDLLPELIAATEGRDLPRAVIHGDLFRDNTLFDGNRLTGLIDFYSAGEGYLLFDLAVTVNDWCSASDGQLQTTLLTPLLQAYVEQRPVSADERQLWPQMLRLAALRFWLSRRSAEIRPDTLPGTNLVASHKPSQEYFKILQSRIQRTIPVLP